VIWRLVGWLVRRRHAALLDIDHDGLDEAVAEGAAREFGARG
jgi:hypothetical protein